MNYEGLLRFSCGAAENHRRLMEEDVFCLVMSPELSDKVIFHLVKEYVLLDIDDDGERRLVIAYGMYRHPPNGSELNSDKFDESVLFEQILEAPRLCLLIREGVSGEQLDALRRAYRVIDFVHEGRERSAIACAIHRVCDYGENSGEGRITSQHWELK